MSAESDACLVECRFVDRPSDPGGRVASLAKIKGGLETR